MQRTVQFYWKRQDGKKIKKAHISGLRDAALTRAHKLSAQGYTSGELIDSVKSNPSYHFP